MVGVHGHTTTMFGTVGVILASYLPAQSTQVIASRRLVALLRHRRPSIGECLVPSLVARARVARIFVGRKVVAHGMCLAFERARAQRLARLEAHLLRATLVVAVFEVTIRLQLTAHLEAIDRGTVERRPDRRVDAHAEATRIALGHVLAELVHRRVEFAAFSGKSISIVSVTYLQVYVCTLDILPSTGSSSSFGHRKYFGQNLGAHCSRTSMGWHFLSK